MPTIRKTTPGESYIHKHGTVAGGDTIAVDPDTAEYLTERGGYERVENDEGDGSDDTDADAEGDDTALADKTYQELRDLASEHDVSGRSDMDKSELVDALGEVL